MMKNDFGKYKSKSGVSVIALVIVISVLLILLSIVIINVNNVSNNAKLSAFASDLSTVEEMTSAYYMQNSSFPTTNETEESLSQGEILDRVEEGNKNSFTNELKLNNDYNTSNDLGEFYIINLNKLDVASSKRGLKNDGENDIYVVSYPSMNIYYLKGIKVKRETYFSLTSKITQKVKVNTNNTDEVENNITVQSVEGFTVKKINNSWTNAMGISVQINLESDEELYLKAGSLPKKKLNLNSGLSEFSFNDLTDLNEFTVNESNAYKSFAQKDKILVFTKLKNSVEVGRIEVQMANYEVIIPNYSIDASNIKYFDEYNVASFNVSDETSGVKEVRYEYLTQFNDKGEVDYYYTNTTEYDEEYLRYKGRRAIPDKSGNISLKVDKGVQGIQLIVIDKAGNIRRTNNNGEILTIGFYNNENDIYIGMNLRANTNTFLKYDAVLVNNKGIKKIEVQTSNDGINFSDVKTINVNNGSQDQKIRFVSDTWENSGKIKKIKISAYDNSQNQTMYTRVFKLNERLTLQIGKITNETTTFNLKTTGSYYNPLVPAGFAPIDEGDAIWGSADGWNNGLVIRDEEDNEFVWIPVEAQTEEEFNSKFKTYPWYLNQTDFSSYRDEESSEEYIAMRNSVKKNGGFYIGRYEAGAYEEGTNIEDDGTERPFVVKGRTPSLQHASNSIIVARAMYPNMDKLNEYHISLKDYTNNTGVISTLIYGCQWDAAMKFIEKDYPDYITNSIAYEGETNGVTGNDGAYNIKNIYDMSGCSVEWTNETNNNNMVYRGSKDAGYMDAGLISRTSIIANRYCYNQDLAAFRIALYINN